MNFISYVPETGHYLLPRDLQAKCPWNICQEGEQQSLDQNTRQYTRAGLPECVLSTISGPLPKTTQDRTHTKDTHSIQGQKLKFSTPPGIEPGPPRLEGRDSTDHAMATDLLIHVINKMYRTTTHTFSCLMLNVLIWERFISVIETPQYKSFQ